MAALSEEENEFDARPPTETQILSFLASDELRIQPLRLSLLKGATFSSWVGQFDGVLEARWGKHRSTFLLECKALNTPKVLFAAVAQINLAASRTKLVDGAKVLPMVVVPYLSEDSLDFLEAAGVSGIDLCGNAVVMGERFLVRRDGRPNRFRSSSAIKNVFANRSSLFARCFLIRERFSSLGELWEFALSRDASSWAHVGDEAPRLTKGTASKVVKVLVDEQIVAREGDDLRLADARRLLDSLRQNYSPYGMRNMDAKTALSAQECWALLGEARGRGLRSVTTGLASAPHYGVLSMADRTTIYVNDFEGALELLEARPSSVFPNLRLVETKSDVPFFDARADGDRLWASPVQTWIEMATGGPRERDAARELESDLMGGGVA